MKATYEGGHYSKSNFTFSFSASVISEDGIVLTKEIEDFKKMTDEERGYRDRLAGYYDKWFRYNRTDGGAAYDKGCVRAVDSGKCPDHFTLIEASESMRNF